MASAPYMDQYLEKRNLTLIRDLDSRAQEQMCNIDGMADDFLSNINNYSGDKKKEKMTDIQRRFDKAKYYADDKVDKHIRKLDLELARFESDIQKRAFRTSRNVDESGNYTTSEEETAIHKTTHKTSTKKQNQRRKAKTSEDLLDDLYICLENRFNQNTLNLISAIGRLIELKTEEFGIELLSQKFVLNNDKLDGELKLLRSLLDFVVKPSNKTIHQWLEKLLTSKNFVNVNKALKLFTTIPVTSCSCERAFSKLSLIKTKLRSHMLQERLDAMTLIFLEQELASQINYEDVIDEFKHLHSFDRRLGL
ncbi:hypothetical protein AGLY_017233 [Aphis glycines]|uniref:Inhibitor of growth protein N-terminal histone-binding domain-containing protein n=1 Tax=Aphis glycines TaxID=307491 RepID=A0A6G0SVV8_APHGL|nr:hypothetical protein AGLY_017233 [Aphis glycines]